MLVSEAVPAGTSITQPMSFENDESLGETKHTTYYDSATHVNPPTSRHAQVARRLVRLLEDAVPDEYEVLPEVGWLVAPQTRSGHRGGPS